MEGWGGAEAGLGELRGRYITGAVEFAGRRMLFSAGTELDLDRVVTFWGAFIRTLSGVCMGVVGAD